MYRIIEYLLSDPFTEQLEKEMIEIRNKNKLLKILRTTKLDKSKTVNTYEMNNLSTTQPETINAIVISCNINISEIDDIVGKYIWSTINLAWKEGLCTLQNAVYRLLLIYFIKKNYTGKIKMCNIDNDDFYVELKNYKFTYTIIDMHDNPKID